MDKRQFVRSSFWIRTVGLIENVLSMLVDAAFLAIWVGTQYGLSLLIGAVDLGLLDAWVLRTFQLVFALSTLIPVLVYVIKDLILMVLIERHSLSSALSSGALTTETTEGETRGDSSAS